MSPARSELEAKKTHQMLGLGILLIACIFLGGGGVSYGILNAAVQLIAILVLGSNFEAVTSFWKAAPRMLRLLITAALAIPIVQLIPVPPALWQSLPSRELVTESLTAAGLTAGWRAISVDSGRTLIALLSLLVPFTILTLGWRCSARRLQLLGWIMIGVGVLVFLWGIPQVLSQGTFGIPYPENPMPGVLFGSFANRNTTAVFFVICLAFALQLNPPARARPFAALLRTGLALVFITGVVLTQSRSGLILIAVPIGLWALRAYSGFAVPTLRMKALIVSSLLIASIAGMAVIGTGDTRFQTVMDRFGDGDGHRMEMWEDAQYASGRYWPIGAGMGTFDEVFQVDESLEYISPRKAGRAHNDYLELAIEGGAAAISILLAWLGWIVWLAWRARRSADRWVAWAGAASLLVIALQSIVDFPARNLSMLGILSLSLTFLIRFSGPPKGQRA